MKKTLQLAIISALAVFSFSITTVFASFPDVSAHHKYKEAIDYIENSGVFDGPIFKPNKLITRGEYAEWIMRDAGFDRKTYTPKTKKRFSDVNQKEDLGRYVYRLMDLGVINEPKGSTAVFSPDKSITTYEALDWLFSLQGVPVPKVFDEESFQAKDVDVNSAEAPLISKALSLGIINPGVIHPTDTLNRARAAFFIHELRTGNGGLAIKVVPNNGELERGPKYEVMQRTWDRIFQTYLHRSDINKEKLMYGAIEGMVKELGDKYSTFERPGDPKILDTLSGQVEGIGAVIQDEEEKLIIVTPLPDSPAEKGGLLPRDVIDTIDGVPVKGLTISEAVAKIKGKRGTQVKIGVLRNGVPLEFIITRDIVKVLSTTLKRTSDNIAVITVTNFGSNTQVEFGGIVKELQLNPARGIIIDLRNNPGGFLSVAVQLAGYFVNSGETVTVVKYPDHEEILTSKGKAELKNSKVVVLVNGGSASASEIFAGALQDYKLATIIGEKSFGKGTVQELVDFSDGSTLKLTVAEWLTPLRRAINKNGVVPDITAKLTAEDRTAKRDPQMDAATNFIQGR